MQHSINRIFAAVGGSKGAVKVGFNPKAVLTSLDVAFVPIGSFRLDYEYDFRISNQGRFQSPRSSCWF